MSNDSLHPTFSKVPPLTDGVADYQFSKSVCILSGVLFSGGACSLRFKVQRILCLYFDSFLCWRECQFWNCVILQWRRIDFLLWIVTAPTVLIESIKCTVPVTAMYDAV